MTWCRWASMFKGRCGSCGRPIENGQQFARVTVGNHPRCLSCAESIQGWCSWPKDTPYVPVVYELSMPNVEQAATQPFAPVRRQVQDYKAKQMRDAS